MLQFFQQILSFEAAADDGDGCNLLSTPIIKTLCNFSGYEPPKLSKSKEKPFQPTRMAPTERRPPTLIPMTKATTTPLVRQFFEHLFKDQLAKADKKISSDYEDLNSSRCGVCGPCLRQVNNH